MATPDHRPRHPITGKFVPDPHSTGRALMARHAKAQGATMQKRSDLASIEARSRPDLVPIGPRSRPREIKP